MVYSCSFIRPRLPCSFSRSAVAPRPRPTFCQGTFQRGDSTAILTGRRPKPRSAESPLQFHADVDGASAAAANEKFSPELPSASAHAVGGTRLGDAAPAGDVLRDGVSY